jgi:hypothetical protein
MPRLQRGKTIQAGALGDRRIYDGSALVLIAIKSQDMEANG